MLSYYEKKAYTVLILRLPVVVACCVEMYINIEGWFYTNYVWMVESFKALFSSNSFVVENAKYYLGTIFFSPVKLLPLGRIVF